MLSKDEECLVEGVTAFVREALRRHTEHAPAEAEAIAQIQAQRDLSVILFVDLDTDPPRARPGMLPFGLRRKVEEDSDG